MPKFIITIDGPAASGKSTTAKLVAEKLDAAFLDTGAMYRAVTLAAMNAGVDMTSEEALLGLLDKTDFHFAAIDGVMEVTVDGVKVTDQIRSPEVTANAHYIARAAKLRDRLVELQRDFAAGQQSIVTEGRDQGTVAFPEADLKIFLTADSDERARRRQLDIQQQGCHKSIEDIKNAIEKRDKADQERAAGPLKPAKDAIIVDTTGLEIGQVVEKVLGYL